MKNSDRFNDGYDLIIGTSDKGNSAENEKYTPFSHALIIFGGEKKLHFCKAFIPLKNSPIRYFQRLM